MKSLPLLLTGLVLVSLLNPRLPAQGVPVLPGFAYLRQTSPHSQSLWIGAVDSLPPAAPLAHDVIRADIAEADLDYPVPHVIVSRVFSHLSASPGNAYVAVRMDEDGHFFQDWWVRLYSMRTGRTLLSLNEHRFDLNQSIFPLPELAAYAEENEYDLALLDYEVEVDGATVPPTFQWNADGTFEVRYRLYVFAIAADSGFHLDNLGEVTFKAVYALTDTSATLISRTSSRVAARSPKSYHPLTLERRPFEIPPSRDPSIYLDARLLRFSGKAPDTRSAIQVVGYVR